MTVKNMNFRNKKPQGKCKLKEKRKRNQMGKKEKPTSSV